MKPRMDFYICRALIHPFSATNPGSRVPKTLRDGQKSTKPLRRFGRPEPSLKRRDEQVSGREIGM